MDDTKPVRGLGSADIAGKRVRVSKISSKELLGARGELLLEHDGRDYRLRLSRNGKLILTA